MSRWHPDKFDQRREALKLRGQGIRALRSFFDARGFSEVETPVLQVMGSADPHIHAFETQAINPDLTKGALMGLHTSPEIAMKKLLVAGAGDIYQICKVFRNGEGSSWHACEFTMLEWYRVGADYTALMDDCAALLQEVAQACDVKAYRKGEVVCDPFLELERLSVAEAFERYAGIDLWAQDFTAACKAAGVRIAEGDSWDDLFFRAMGERIEPQLGLERPCVLYEYPVHMAALSRRKYDDQRVAERFELYVCGVELANAFSELTDAAEQRARLMDDLALKKELYGADVPLDEDFIAALEYGMPESAGIALGVDRLIMLACGVEDIAQVVW